MPWHVSTHSLLSSLPCFAVSHLPFIPRRSFVQSCRRAVVQSCSRVVVLSYSRSPIFETQALRLYCCRFFSIITFLPFYYSPFPVFLSSCLLIFSFSRVPFSRFLIPSFFRPIVPSCLRAVVPSFFLPHQSSSPISLNNCKVSSASSSLIF